MSSFPILDLILGIIFLYFLLSIISSSVIEIALSIMRVRAKVLEEWFMTIFQNKIEDAKGQQVELGVELLDHCAVTALSKKIEPKKSRAPSYIDAKNFVSALLDKIKTHSAQQDPKTITELITSLTTTTALPPELRQTLLTYAYEADDTLQTFSVKTIGALELFRSKLENWYDSNMDRLTGAMKNLYTRKFTFVTAVVITVLLNADTISISKYLYSNDEARTAIAVKSIETASDEKMKAEVDRLKSMAGTDTAKINSLDQLKDSLSARINAIKTAKSALEQSLPIGWSLSEFPAKKDGWGWFLFIVSKVLGMAVTVLAIMMGAPFWFDVLNKIANLRGTGPKPPSTTGSSK